MPLLFALPHLTIASRVLPEGSNLRLFKADITPSWEHPANAKGGRWVIVLYYSLLVFHHLRLLFFLLNVILVIFS